MFKEFDFFDFVIYLSFIILAVGGSIGLYKLLAHGTEKSCVNYYLEKNYILEECEVYRERLESLGE